LVGLFVYLASSADSSLDPQAQGWKQKAVTWFIAGINTVCLFMAAVGESTI